MKIVLVSKLDKKMKTLGNSDTHPIPRVGETVWAGYTPSPKVVEIGYVYEDDTVMVIVDGFVLS